MLLFVVSSINNSLIVIFIMSQVQNNDNRKKTKLCRKEAQTLCAAVSFRSEGRRSLKSNHF